MMSLVWRQMSIVKLCRLCHDDGEVVQIISWIVDRLKLLVHRVLLQAWAFENKTTFFSDFAKWVILCFTSVREISPPLVMFTSSIHKLQLYSNCCMRFSKMEVRSTCCVSWRTWKIIHSFWHCHAITLTTMAPPHTSYDFLFFVFLILFASSTWGDPPPYT